VAEIWKILVLGELEQKVHRTPSQHIDYACWYGSVIGAMKDALVGDFGLSTALSKSIRHYIKNT
jgi:hypothetical protein